MPPLTNKELPLYYTCVQLVILDNTINEHTLSERRPDPGFQYTQLGKRRITQTKHAYSVTMSQMTLYNGIEFFHIIWDSILRSRIHGNPLNLQPIIHDDIMK